MAPAVSNLSSPCLTGPITEYDWATGIALMTIFTMFFIELMASRFDVFGEDSHDLEAADPSKELMRQGEKSGPMVPFKDGKHILPFPTSFFPLHWLR